MNNVIIKEMTQDPLTVPALAKFLNCSTGYISRLCRDNRIKSVKVHSQTYIITDKEIIKCFKTKNLEAAKEYLKKNK